jgi:hypothetical protein
MCNRLQNEKIIDFRTAPIPGGFSGTVFASTGQADT